MSDFNNTLPPIPSPAKRRIALRVTPSAERRLRHGHPWLYSDAVTSQSHEGQPGDLAVIFDHDRKFLAIGLYDPTSSIRVRILQHNKPATIDQYWFAEKFEEAAKVRLSIPDKTNGYRLIHGENDSLPGLVVDRYADSLVIKLYTPAWIPYLSVLTMILIDSLTPKRIVLRMNRAIQRNPQLSLQLEDRALIYGAPLDGAVLFIENGITFEADLMFGQKTGFFLDQRDNRAKVEKLSMHKRVLNIFSYTGSFSVYAARGGAREVVSVDSSRPALDAAQRNFAHNKKITAVAGCHHTTFAGDAFELLNSYARAKQLFDLVIIDPPAFAKKRAEVVRAVKAYQHLTRLAVALLTPGGILVQASCSSQVSSSDFFKSVHLAARQTNRPLKEIERTGHALDHPIGFPEGKYLKCLFAIG